MFKRLKWRVRRIWKGPGTTTHGSSQSEWSLLIANDGGLERKLKDFGFTAWIQIRRFFKWVIAAVILAAIAFFVPHLLGEWFK